MIVVQCLSKKYFYIKAVLKEHLRGLNHSDVVFSSRRVPKTSVKCISDQLLVADKILESRLACWSLERLCMTVYKVG